MKGKITPWFWGASVLFLVLAISAENPHTLVVDPLRPTFFIISATLFVAPFIGGILRMLFNSKLGISVFLVLSIIVLISLIK